MDSLSNSPGPRSGLPPDQCSVVRPTVPSEPSTKEQERSFLFINAQDDVSQEFGVGRQKKAFLSKVAHQRRKKESIERLKCIQDTKKHRETAEGLLEALTRQGLIGYLGQGCADPFDASSVPMTGTMNMYLHHFCVQLAPAAIPLNGAQEGIIYAQKSTGLPALRCTILFMAAGNKAALESSHGVASSTMLKSSQDAVRHRIEAIKCLNQLLQKPVTAVAESTILCVSIMKHCEALNAQFMESQAHTRGLNTLIALVGGLEGLEHKTLASIYQGDIANAALYNLKPCYPILPRFRSEVLDEAEMFHGGTSNYEYGHQIPPSLSSLGTRFNKAPWRTGLDSDMKKTISACCRLIVHFEMATMLPRLVKPTDKDLYIMLKHHLLSLHYSPQNDDFNEPLRRALFIYTWLRVWRYGNFPITRYIVDGLRQSLIPRLGYIRVTAPDLLFWILFMGSMASQGHESHPWFVGYLREMAAHLELTEWEKARSILIEFFYTDQPGYTRGEDLWDEVSAPP